MGVIFLCSLCLRGRQRRSRDGKDVTTYHVVNFVHANKTCRKFEHVVAQRDDNELCVLSALLDIARNNRDLSMLALGSRGDFLANQTYISEIQRSVDLVHDIQRRRLVVM
jgi:hypothetical protein